MHKINLLKKTYEITGKKERKEKRKRKKEYNLKAECYGATRGILEDAGKLSQQLRGLPGDPVGSQHPFCVLPAAYNSNSRGSTASGLFGHLLSHAHRQTYHTKNYKVSLKPCCPSEAV